MARRKAPRISDALLDQLLAGADPKSAFGADGLLDDLKKALAERALNAEMEHHLASAETGNSRNGHGHKTVTTETSSRPAEKVPWSRRPCSPACRSRLGPGAPASRQASSLPGSSQVDTRPSMPTRRWSAPARSVSWKSACGILSESPQRRKIL